MKSWSENLAQNIMDGNYGSEDKILFRRDFVKSIPGQSNKSSSKRGKRFRSAFTTEQVNFLEKEFKKYPYIGNARRKDVANSLNIAERAVKIWFQNRRMKEKKDGAKESDEIKHLETCSEQLRNLSVITPNKLHSLPVVLPPKSSQNYVNVNNNNIDEGKLNLSMPRCVKSSFYKDISPEREPSKVMNSSCVQKSSSESPITFKPDLSTDLIKKYKDRISKQTDLQEAIDLKERRSSPTYKELKEPLFVSTFAPAAVPEDLSANKTVHFDHSNLNRTLSSGNTEFPLYLNEFYGQPYIAPGNMMWKPMNVAPVMPTGFTALNVSNNAPVNLTIGQGVPKSCNCDCHLKPYCTPILYHQSNPSSQVQYVLTALPISTQSSKY